MQKIDLVDHDLFNPGHAACPGCQESLALRAILNTIGSDAAAVFPPSCGAVICGPHPYSSLNIPVFQTTLESAAAAASGLRRALNQRGKRDSTVVCFAGDGGTYDIGFQALSSAVERNEDILYVCFDNEGYMNTGAQKSSSTPLHASTASTPGGKVSRKKDMMGILAAHGIPYAATAATSHMNDLIAKVKKAMSMRGSRFLAVLVPCLDGWGLPDDSGVGVARLAVDCGMWPLYEVEDGDRYTLNQDTKPATIDAYLKIQKRYRHLDNDRLADLQAFVDRDWERLRQRAAVSARTAA
jgi:pyruvate ferredoxin oxidoreductase beta subunit/2-oxoisovalerate ferredoxin oxidoreductase beta subunit